MDSGEVYFAYGSNMLESQMRGRCPSARFLRAGRLHNYRLFFPRWSDRWGCGVAGVKPNPGDVVEGVLYTLSLTDLKELDEIEGVSAGRYQRVQTSIEFDEEEHLECWMYLAIEREHASCQPSKAYREALLRGALEHGLSDSYTDHLRTIDIQEDF